MMQRAASLILASSTLLLGILPGHAPPGLEAGPPSVSRIISLDPSQVRVVEREGVARIELRGAATGLPEGHPDLPLLPILILLPEGTEAASARITVLETRPVGVAPSLAAVPHPAAGLDEAWTSVVPGTFSEDYPPQPLFTVSTGRMRGQNVAMVAMSPLTWSPGTGILRLGTRIQVDVELRSTDPRPGDFIVRRESPAGRAVFSGALGTLTGSRPAPLRENLRPQSGTGSPFAPTFRPTEDGSPVEMVIVTTADQEAAYNRLADYHTRTGIRTVVRTVEWILANYPRGADVPETIRTFIQDAASAWGTVWVLVGGDTDTVPIRYTKTLFHQPGGEEIPTDLYYGDLDGTWDADGDGFYAEAELGNPANNDLVDLLPDVWVGRLPSSDPEQANLLVDKTLAYLSDPPLGYQGDLLLLGEVLFPGNWTPGTTANYDGAEMCEDVAAMAMPAQRVVRMYENHTAWPGSVPELKSAVIDSVNAGFGLVHHVGHGYINTMSVGLGGETLSNADVDQFQNGTRTFLLYAVNCTSCAVDFNCIGERFLLNPGGGAVAVCGATRYEFPLTSWNYQNEFYRLLFEEGVTDLGRAFSLSRIPFVSLSQVDSGHRWTQFALISMGDPALPIWTESPLPLSVYHPATTYLGTGSFTVNVEREGVPLPGAKITLYKEDDAYSVGFTDAAGQITLPFDADQPGTLSVGAVAPGSLPYMSPVVVIAPSSPVLSPAGRVVIDDGTGLSDGNGDARIDSGETVELRFEITNAGATAAPAPITAHLSVLDPRVAVLDSVAEYPSVVAGGLSLSTDTMVLSFGHGIADRSEIGATLTLTDASGSLERAVTLHVHAPQLELRDLAVRDTVGTGDGDGVPETGEDLVLLPLLRNHGLGTLRGAELRLRSDDPGVQVTDSVSVLGDLGPGETSANPGDGLGLFLNGVDPTAARLRLAVLDAYGEILSLEIDLVPPPVPENLIAFAAAHSIRLRWDPVATPGLWGYNVYRGQPPGDNLTRLNAGIWGRSSTYEDTELPALTEYVYAVSAVDSSGNEGPRSGVFSASTSLPIHDGWPIELAIGTPAGIALADLDGDGELEILGTGEEIYVVRPDGMDFHDGDADARTLGPLTNTGGVQFWNTPTAGDVDGDGDGEVAAPGWDGLLYLVDHQGQPLPGWPRSANALGALKPNPIGSACLADLDLDGDLEVLCSVGTGIYAWGHDGVEVVDGDNDPLTDGVLAVTGANYSYGTPSVGNIDGDPYPEIVAGMRDGNLYVFHHDGTPYAGFPFVTGGNITSSPALGDIDGNGQVEIVFGSSDGNLYAVRADGSVPAGFPVPMPFVEDWDPSPALGDLDGDGFLDVVVASSDGLLHALHGQSGMPLPGFPYPIVNSLGQPVTTRSSAVLVDLNGDGGLDVILGDRSGRLLAISRAGTPLPGFPIQTSNALDGSPAVWDIDRDGRAEVIAQSLDQKIYIWDTPWIFSPSRAVWPMFKRNAKHTGDFGDEGPSRVGVPDTPPPARLLLAQNAPNPFVGSTRIRYRIPEGQGSRDVELRVFDLAGRSVRALVLSPQAPGPYEVTWDGRDDAGRPTAAGVYAYRLRVGAEATSRKMILLR